MGGMGGRYSMRDRTRKEARYSPPKEEMRERQRCVAAANWQARRTVTPNAAVWSHAGCLRGQ